MKKAVDDGLKDALNKYDGHEGVWKDQIDYLQKEVRTCCSVVASQHLVSLSRTVLIQMRPDIINLPVGLGENNFLYKHPFAYIIIISNTLLKKNDYVQELLVKKKKEKKILQDLQEECHI